MEKNKIREGHICPVCESSNSIVYDTTRPDMGTETYKFRRIRRRKCKNCGFKWITIEINWWDVQEYM